MNHRHRPRRQQPRRARRRFCVAVAVDANDDNGSPPPRGAPSIPGPSYVQSIVPTLSATLRGQLHRHILELTREYGENVMVRFPTPWDEVVFLTDPVAIYEVMEVANPPKAPEFVRGIQ